jgi:hypothetical protein
MKKTILISRDGGLRWFDGEVRGESLRVPLSVSTMWSEEQIDEATRRRVETITYKRAAGHVFDPNTGAAIELFVEET